MVKIVKIAVVELVDDRLGQRRREREEDAGRDPEQRRPPRRRARVRPASTSGTQTARQAPIAISQSPSGASARPPEGSAKVRKATSAATTRKAAPTSIRRHLLPGQPRAERQREDDAGDQQRLDDRQPAEAERRRLGDEAERVGGDPDQPDRPLRHLHEQAGARPLDRSFEAGALLKDGAEREEERRGEGESDVHPRRV